MGLTNYSYTFIIEAYNQFNDGSLPELFKGILHNDGEGNLNYGISKELGYLFESENQFNKVFSEEYGSIVYTEIFSSETVESLGTLEDAKPWFESSELTLIAKTEDEFDYYNTQILLQALGDIIKYLNGFVWHTERPKLFERLDEFKLLKVVVAYCNKNEFEIKSIMA